MIEHTGMKKDKQGINIIKLSEYRTVLMGLATLGILFCHFNECRSVNNLLPTPLSKVLALGISCVDIFMLLSGFGLYYSLHKNGNIRAFYKKRCIKLLPTYFIIASVYWVIKDIIMGKAYFGRFFYDLLFGSWIMEGVKRFWFIGAILVFYFLFPLIYKFLNLPKIKDTWSFIIMVGLVVIVSLLLRVSDWPIYDNISIAFERLPAFIFGAYLGKRCIEGKSIRKWWLLGIVALTICMEVYTRLGKLVVAKIIPIPSGYTNTMLGISIIIILIWILDRLRALRLSGTVICVLTELGGLLWRFIYFMPD